MNKVNIKLLFLLEHPLFIGVSLTLGLTLFMLLLDSQQYGLALCALVVSVTNYLFYRVFTEKIIMQRLSIQLLKNQNNKILDKLYASGVYEK